MASCECLLELITMDHGDVVDWVDHSVDSKVKGSKAQAHGAGNTIKLKCLVF